MTSPRFQPEQESIALRILWMLLFLLVWQVAQLMLGVVVALQLIHRLVQGAPNVSLMSFGDSLSRYLAQIGSFGAFHTELKPWPFADWPAARPGEQFAQAPAPAPVAPAAAAEPVAPVAPVGPAPGQEPPL